MKELTILMPCLNEEETLETCIKKAKQYLDSRGIVGEVLIADNGSTDSSIAIANRLGARVVHVKSKGYGNALISGIENAESEYIIMGDSDDSYDFSNLDAFVEKLREGIDLVMGNRFQGGIKQGAMPFLHKYLGNPVLSFIGRLFFKIKIGDFHCGLRGFSTIKMRNLNLSCTGMEFASEMIVKASLNNLTITEVPTILSPDGRSRPPHLRTWRDGWRHLRFLLMFSPKWLFFIPGFIMLITGFSLTSVLFYTPIQLIGISLDIHTMIFTALAVVLGYQLLYFYLFLDLYTYKFGLKLSYTSKSINSLVESYGILVGLVFIFVGIIFLINAFTVWKAIDFGPIYNPIHTIKLSLVAFLFVITGAQTIFNSFFISILSIKVNSV